MDEIVMPKGETLVMLALEEYERLMDAADVGAGTKVRTDVVRRILASENPVRVWREHRSLSGRALAGKAEVSAAYISEIETGKKDGSVAAMMLIARTLDVDIDDLV